MTRPYPMKFCYETRAVGLFRSCFPKIRSADSLIAPLRPKNSQRHGRGGRNLIDKSELYSISISDN